MDKQAMSKDFRYDINALRAIAVLGVVFFHYQLGRFQGGFSGVDIFFVISGYLMTRIIINGLDKNRFSFAEFYGRRLRRILPALLFLLVVVSITCFICYFPNDFKVNQKNAAASAVFLSNIFYWQSVNYFAPASSDNVFLHTWSLSAEWQFYLLYPVLLIGLYKLLKGKKQHLSYFILTAALSFAGAVLWNQGRSKRVILFIAGTCLGNAVRRYCIFSAGLYQVVKNKSSSCHCRLLNYCVLPGVLRSTMPWPGSYTLLPVLATFMVVVANYDFKLLKFPAIQFVAKFHIHCTYGIGQFM